MTLERKMSPSKLQAYLGRLVQRFLHSQAEQSVNVEQASWQRLRQLSTRNGIEPARTFNMTSQRDNHLVEPKPPTEGIGHTTTNPLHSMANWLALRATYPELPAASAPASSGAELTGSPAAPHAPCQNVTGPSVTAPKVAPPGLVPGSADAKSVTASRAADVSYNSLSRSFAPGPSIKDIQLPPPAPDAEQPTPSAYSPPQPTSSRAGANAGIRPHARTFQKLSQQYIDTTPPAEPAAPPPQEYNLCPHAEPESGSPSEVSESARSEMLRIQQSRRGHAARTLALAGSDPDPDQPAAETTFADEWNVSGANSLFALTDEQSRLSAPEPATKPYEDAAAQTGSATSESSPAEIAQKVTQAAKEAAKERAARDPSKRTAGAPEFQSRHNPYRNYSETALMLLAQNPNTATTTLYWLCGHSQADIRSAAARNASCPPEALAILARDHEAGIRHSVAENPRSTPQILEMLSSDKNPLIAWRAQIHMSLAKGKRTVTDLKPMIVKATPPSQSLSGAHLPFSDDLCATEETIAFLRLIARRTNTPPRRLAELARHPDARVRAAVAENANTPLELLWLLAKDNSQEVKLRITENYNCPIEVLEVLKDDGDSFVAWQAKAVINKISSPIQTNINPDGRISGNFRRGVISRELT